MFFHSCIILGWNGRSAKASAQGTLSRWMARISALSARNARISWTAWGVMSWGKGRKAQSKAPRCRFLGVAQRHEREGQQQNRRS